MKPTDEAIQATVNAFTNQGHDKILSGMQPFTITITDPKDAALLFSAVLHGACNWNTEAGMKLSEILALYCNKYGNDAGIEMFMEDSNAKGLRIPAWFKPLQNYVFGIAENNFKKFQ